MSTFRFEDKSTSKSWMVRIVKQGDKYGLNNCLTHDKPVSMVEFYDTSNGEQFVSRYYVETFLGIDDGVGLMLDGGCSAWNLDAESVGSVKEWINNGEEKHAVQLTGEEVNHLLFALSCVDSDLQEHHSLVKKLKEY